MLCILPLSLSFFLLFSIEYNRYSYSPNGRAEPPRWACALCALGLFIYQSLDAIDGKQARRTNSSSPLGELFDHGCDSISTIFVALSACLSAQLGFYPKWMFFQVTFMTSIIHSFIHSRIHSLLLLLLLNFIFRIHKFIYTHTHTHTWMLAQHSVSVQWPCSTVRIGNRMCRAHFGWAKLMLRKLNAWSCWFIWYQQFSDRKSGWPRYIIRNSVNCYSFLEISSTPFTIYLFIKMKQKNFIHKYKQFLNR